MIEDKTSPEDAGAGGLVAKCPPGGSKDSSRQGNTKNLSCCEVAHTEFEGIANSSATCKVQSSLAW